MTKGAIISPCDLYRYHLWRIWDENLPTLIFVMQNPSTADADADDPTIRKCIGFAERNGYGAISVRNVFAYRATNEKELLKCADPYGPDNDTFLRPRIRDEFVVDNRLVLAWGTRFGGKKLDGYYVKAMALLFMRESRIPWIPSSGAMVCRCVRGTASSGSSLQVHRL